jgi:hypothetical protein
MAAKFLDVDDTGFLLVAAVIVWALCPADPNLGAAGLSQLHPSKLVKSREPRPTPRAGNDTAASRDRPASPTTCPGTDCYGVFAG